MVAPQAEGELLAQPEELRQGRAEGVEVWTETMVVGVEFSPGQRVVVKLAAARMKCDRDGVVRPVPVPGTERLMTAAALVYAVGQEVDPASLPDGVPLQSGLLQVDEHTLRWGQSAFYAEGDLVANRRFVAGALAAGRRWRSTKP